MSRRVQSAIFGPVSHLYLFTHATIGQSQLCISRKPANQNQASVKSADKVGSQNSRSIFMTYDGFLSSDGIGRFLLIVCHWLYAVTTCWCNCGFCEICLLFLFHSSNYNIAFALDRAFSLLTHAS